MVDIDWIMTYLWVNFVLTFGTHKSGTLILTHGHKGTVDKLG